MLVVSQSLIKLSRVVAASDTRNIYNKVKQMTKIQIKQLYDTIDGCDYGTLEYKGKTLTIYQEPYPDTNLNDRDTEYYYSIAFDDCDNEYEIEWKCNAIDAEGEQYVRNWDKFRVVNIHNSNLG